MNTTRKQILPIEFRPAAEVRLTIQPGIIRRAGVAPLLRKSVPAMMAAKSVQALAIAA